MVGCHSLCHHYPDADNNYILPWGMVLGPDDCIYAAVDQVGCCYVYVAGLLPCSGRSCPCARPHSHRPAGCLLQGYDVAYYAEPPPSATGCIIKVTLDAQTGAMGASSRWVLHRGTLT